MGNTYAVSDLHGQYDLWKQIQEYLEPDDRLVICGDCTDRGQRGIDILLEAVADTRCFVLKGNHELIMQQYLTKHAPTDLKIWLWNGGQPTFDAIPEDEKALLELIEKMPNWARYKKVFLCHAGCTPPIDVDNLDEEDFLWNRYHFYDDWKSVPLIDKVVFGHTPISYLEEELKTWRIPYENENGIKLTFADGHKICIDAGCFATGHIGLLDLDTFEIKEFTCEI